MSIKLFSNLIYKDFVNTYAQASDIVLLSYFNGKVQYVGLQEKVTGYPQYLAELKHRGRIYR